MSEPRDGEGDGGGEDRDGDRPDRVGAGDGDGDRLTEAELARKRPRTPVARLIALMVLGVGVPAAGLALAWRSCTRGVTGGSVDVAGSTLGSWRVSLDRCTTLAGQGLRAVELGRGDGRPLVRLELDPLDGPIVSLWSADATADARPMMLRRRDCPDLAADLRSLGSSDDDAPERFDGKLAGSCALPGGGTLRVDLWWRGCGGAAR